jgi:hypothetical protein
MQFHFPAISFTRADGNNSFSPCEATCLRPVKVLLCKGLEALKRGYKQNEIVLAESTGSFIFNNTGFRK